MGKITPPTIVRIDTHEAVVSIRQLMETIATLQSLASTSPEPRNCQNCGAPLHGDKCEYCGTEYRTNKTPLQWKTQYTCRSKGNTTT